MEIIYISVFSTFIFMFLVGFLWLGCTGGSGGLMAISCIITVLFVGKYFFIVPYKQYYFLQGPSARLDTSCIKRKYHWLKGEQLLALFALLYSCLLWSWLYRQGKLSLFWFNILHLYLLDGRTSRNRKQILTSMQWKIYRTGLNCENFFQIYGLVVKKWGRGENDKLGKVKGPRLFKF